MTDLPGNVEFIVAHEVGMITLEGIQDKCLVGLGDFRFRKPPLVCEIHFGRDRTCLQSRGFGVHF